MQNREKVVGLLAQLIPDESTAIAVVDLLLEKKLLKLEYGDQDVASILSTFADTFGTTKTSRTDRFAASRMAKKYSTESVVTVIKMLATKSNERYAPMVGSVTQLESKWVNVIFFLKKNQDAAGEIIQL